MKSKRLIHVRFERAFPGGLSRAQIPRVVAWALAWRRRLPAGILIALLAWTLGAAAQDTNAPVLTNGVSQADDLTSGDASQPAEEDAAGTNTVAETNEVMTPGPDGRARRRSRQAQNRARSGAQIANETRTGSPGTNSEPGRLDYSAFSLIVERNIFDPNRVPHSGRPGPPPKTVDAFTLVGTMSYEKGIFAFFDGTSADYKKVLKPEDHIAGYKVVAISPDAVKLALNTNVLELSVGTQMRRREDGTWERSASAETYAASSSSNSTSSEPASSGAESDIIKKMMMRREKE